MSFLALHCEQPLLGRRRNETDHGIWWQLYMASHRSQQLFSSRPLGNIRNATVASAHRCASYLLIHVARRVCQGNSDSLRQ